jgi:hypothetical protein
VTVLDAELELKKHATYNGKKSANDFFFHLQPKSYRIAGLVYM